MGAYSLRRRRRSRFGAFALGLVLAASGAGLAITAHDLLAPPTTRSADDTGVIEYASSALERWSRVFGQQGSEQAASAEPQASPPGSVPSVADRPGVAADAFSSKQQIAASESGRALARDIQLELQRVGCLATGAHGRWDDATRLALMAFAEIVRVSVDAGAPNYVHLTLLQGHGTRACVRPCSADGGVAGCVPRSVIARQRAPAGAETVTSKDERRDPAASPPPAPVAAATPRATLVPPPPVLVREGQFRTTAGNPIGVVPPTSQSPSVQPPQAARVPVPAQPEVADVARASPGTVPGLPTHNRSALGGPLPPIEPGAPSGLERAAIPSAALVPAPTSAAPAGAASRLPTPRDAKADRTARQRETPGAGGGGSEGQRRAREVFSRVNHGSP